MVNYIDDNDVRLYSYSAKAKKLRREKMLGNVFEFLAMLISAGLIYVLMWMCWSILGN